MKRYSFLVAVLMMWSVGSFAQYDDVYYNPDNSSSKATTLTSPQKSSQSYAPLSDNRVSSYEGQSLDDDAYDYYYTSRIRRFHRPLYGFNYFDPYYTDLYYYDPFLPASYTALIYDTPYSYSNWAYASAARRAAFYGPAFYSPFFRPSAAFGYNSFYGPTFGLGFNTGWGSAYAPGGFYSPVFGGGGFYGGGFYGGSALYCPPSYGSGGYAYNTPTTSNTAYSPRSGTSTTTPGNVSTVTRPSRTPVQSYRSNPAVSTTDPNATINSGTRSVSPTNSAGARSAVRDRYTGYSGTRSIDNSRSINTDTYRTTRTRTNTYSAPRSVTPSRSPSSFDTGTRSFSAPRSSTPQMSSPAPRMSSPAPRSSSSGARSRGND